MTDTDTTNTPETTKVKSKRQRQLPHGQIVNEIPASRKTSTWDIEFEWFQQNPGSIKLYEDVSQTTPSYLRNRYGLDAKGRNTRNKRVDMYVTFFPERADAIKAKAKGNKRPAVSEGTPTP